MTITRTRSLVLAFVAAIGLAACYPPAPPPPPPSGPVPTISSIAPESGLMVGKEGVTITGTGFTDATSVTFGGIEATSFSVDSDTQIFADTPAHDAGPARVVVTGPGGSSTDPVDFTFEPVADLVGSVTVVGGSSDNEFLITHRVTNEGPAAVVDTDATFTLEQSHGVAASDALVTGGSFTSGSCSESGNSQAAVWQLICADVAMAPGEFIEVTFHVRYDTAVSFKAWCTALDGTVPDHSGLNNYAEGTGATT